MLKIENQSIEQKLIQAETAANDVRSAVADADVTVPTSAAASVVCRHDVTAVVESDEYEHEHARPGSIPKRW